METLLPVNVPWRISLTIPCLALHLDESSNTELRFRGEVLSSTGEPVETDVIVVMNPGHWLRVKPAASDATTLDELHYDKASIPLMALLREDRIRWKSTFLEEWRRSQVCPDPRSYTVPNSNWVAEVSKRINGHRHYVFCGEDIAVEALTRGISWQIPEESLAGQA
jgi:hypothetical protein